MKAIKEAQAASKAAEVHRLDDQRVDKFLPHEGSTGEMSPAPGKDKSKRLRIKKQR
jgi:hypothetical protein